MVKVSWLKSHAAFGYFKGDSCEISAAAVAKYKLIDGGFVHVVTTDDNEGEDENTLPEGLPLRDLLYKNGFKSVENIVNVSKKGLMELDGVGSTSADKVFNFLIENELIE